MASGPLRAEPRRAHRGSVTFSLDPQPVRILVVDPDDRTRESLCGIIGIGERCVVVGNAGDADTALALASSLRPDIVVIDAHLDHIEPGSTFPAAVRAASPGTRVVVMCRTELPDAESRCAGFDGIIRKTYRPRELIDALLATGEPISRRGALPC